MRIPALPRLALAVALAGTLAAGCAPSIAPTYRDYRIEAERSELPVAERLAAALGEAGWTLAESDAPNVLTTEPRLIDRGVFSRTEVSLDLAPLNDRFVRVYVQAVRWNVFGARSKPPYLSTGLRRRALSELTDALRSRGLVALDAPRERDEEATE